jgi:DNA repair protein RadC
MDKEGFTIHDSPLKKRPREKFKEFSSEALSTAELSVLISGRGISGESVLSTLQRLLKRFGV